MFGGQNPQEFMNAVGEHINKDPKHADLQGKIRTMREGELKHWQDRLVHAWTNVQAGTKTEDEF